MKISAQNHLHTIFTEKNSPLQKIFNTYEAHQRLKQVFTQTLPEIYQNQVHFIFYQGGVMTIKVNNSAILTRITYNKKELLDHFKKYPEWAGLREIKVKLLI